MLFNCDGYTDSVLLGCKDMLSELTRDDQSSKFTYFLNPVYDFEFDEVASTLRIA